MILSNESGTGLVLAILVVVAILVLGMSLAFVARTDMNISGHQTQYVTAVYVAEAGVEESLHRLALRNPTDVTVNGVSMNAAIRDTASPLDPDWTARIFLCAPGAVPAAGSSEFHTATVQDASSWLHYSHATDLAQVLTIRHKWRDRDGDGTRELGEIVFYDAAKYPPENFATGSPIEVLTATGRHGSAERQIRVEATRLPINVNVLAALLSDGVVDLRGNAGVCGHNHVIDTPENTGIPACAGYVHCNNEITIPPALCTCLQEGCLIGVVTTGDEIRESGSTDMGGYPTQSNTDSTNTFYTLAQTLGLTQEEVDEILALADWHSANDADPLDGITYCDYDCTGGDKFNAVTGSGLLYVDGDLDCAGGFVWRGLVYVEGDWKVTGNGWVLGAAVVKGRTEVAVNFGTGTIDVLYSKDALDFYLRQNLKYVKLNWKETSGLAD